MIFLLNFLMIQGFQKWPGISKAFVDSPKNRSKGHVSCLDLCGASMSLEVSSRNQQLEIQVFPF